MSRIIDRLVGASGGWERFLYQTLKEVCEKVGDRHPAESEDAIEEAREILEAYEETGRKDQPNQIVPTPQVQKVVEDDGCDEVVKLKPDGGELSDEVIAKGVSKPVEIELEDLILTPPDRPVPRPKRLKSRVRVGKDVGASSGELPTPANSKIVNRQNLSITTATGLQLGSGSMMDGEEGQIKSQHVSGHISSSGVYRLVFKDVKLGTALIQYDIIALPTKMNKKQFITEVAMANKISVERLHERLVHFELDYTPCNCGLANCFGWKIVDRGEIEVAEEEQKRRLGAVRVGAISESRAEVVPDRGVL